MEWTTFGRSLVPTPSPAILTEFHNDFPQSPLAFSFPILSSSLFTCRRNVPYQIIRHIDSEGKDSRINDHSCGFSCWSLFAGLLYAQTPSEVSSFNFQSVTADPLQPFGVQSRCNLLCSTVRLFEVWIVSNAQRCLLYRI